MKYLALLVGIVAFFPMAACLAVLAIVATVPAALACLFGWLCYGCLTYWGQSGRPS